MLGSKRTPLIGYSSSVQRNLDNSVGTATKTFGQVMKSLFANNEQGFALDFYDTNVLFQDAAGTIPVTGAAQPMGLVLDKSKGLVLGSNIQTNGTGDSISNWNTYGTSLTLQNGSFRLVGIGAGTVVAAPSIPVVNGKFYAVTLSVKADVATNTVSVGFRSKANPGVVTSLVQPIIDVDTTYKTITVFLATNAATEDTAVCFRFSGTEAINVDWIEVKELSGNHAYQTTSSMRPLLRDNPRRADYDGVDDKLLVNLPSTLTNCTVVRATAFAGVEVDTGVTITSPMTLNTDACASLVINRALTAKELSDVRIAFEQLLRVSRVKYLIQSMFANGEVGFAYDMEDITPEKTAWRRNLLTETEFRNGLTDAPIRGGNLSTTSLTGFATGVQIDYNAGSSYLYKSITLPIGSSVTFSAYVQSLDGSSLKLAANNADATGDFMLVTANNADTRATLQSLGGGLYRVSATLTNITSNSANYGVVKYAGNSNKAFKITGYQLEYGSLTDYQPITDFKTEFLKAFPQHVLYQDIAGTTPALLPSDPVSLFLDKSKGLVLGAEFVTNNWKLAGLSDWTYSNGVLTKSSTTAGGGPTQANTSPFVAGRLYRVEYEVLSISGGLVGIQFVGGTPKSTAYRGLVGKYVEYVFTEAGNNYLRVVANTNTALFSVKVISVKELAGNHACQPTSSCRPLLGRHPVGGARNLLTYSGTVTDASWIFAGGTKTGGQLDSDGGYTATKITGPSTGPTLKINTTAPITGAYTYTVCLKAGTQTTAELLLRNSTTSTNFTIGTINLTTGVITGAGWTSKAKPNGFWECSFTQATGISKDDALYCYYGTLGSATASFDIIVDYAQLEVGSVATTYQETTTLLDITERGKADAWYLKYDGVDDFLYTNAIDFTGTDKVSLFSGVLKLSDAASGMVFELSSSIGTSNGVFNLAAPSISGNPEYVFSSKGTTATTARATGYPAPISNVVAAIGDLVQHIAKIRINGVDKQVTILSQGTGKYGNYPLYIGRRGGTTVPFSGHIYSLVGVGRLTTDFETSQLEQALSKTVGVNI